MAVHPQDTTNAGQFRAGRAPQRATTSVEGYSNAAQVGLKEADTRLAVIAAIGERQEHEVLAIRRCFSRIVTLGHAPSANLARAGLAHLSRAVELNAIRAEHIGIVQGMVASARDMLRTINATIEMSLVGRSRLGGASCAP